VTDEDIVKALTQLGTKLEYVEKALGELKNELKAPKSPLLPVTGGLVGLAAAVWTGYLQASGHA
jgi:hypothetical protein